VGGRADLCHAAFDARSQLKKSGVNRLQHTVEIAVHLLVGEAQNGIALHGERCRAGGVMSSFLIRRMRRSIHLDDQPSVEANEVSYEIAKDNLTPKAEPRDLLASQALPQTSFRIGRVVSK
jgi:hypothetical protein